MLERKYKYLGILGALLVPALATAALTIPHVFSSGDPVSAAQINANFSAVAGEVSAASLAIDEARAELLALQAEVSALKDRSAADAAVAGYFTRPPSTTPVPYYRRVYQLAKTGATLRFDSGLGSSLPGRALSCQVSTLPAVDDQSFQHAVDNGVAAYKWCEVEGSEVWIEFWTASAIATVFVTLDYTL